MRKFLSLVVIVGLLAVPVQVMAGGPQPVDDNQAKFRFGANLRGKILEMQLSDGSTYFQGRVDSGKTLKEEEASRATARSNYTGFTVEMGIDYVKTPKEVSNEEFLENFSTRMDPQVMGTVGSEKAVHFGYTEEATKWSSSEELPYDDLHICTLGVPGYVGFELDIKLEPEATWSPGLYRADLLFTTIPNK